MAHLLRMPEVAADSAEAVLQEWSVGENETFAAEDTLATIETEKAVVDMEAEVDGVIVRALVPAGTRVAVGAPIAVVAAPGEAVADPDALLAELGVGDVAPAADPAEAPAAEESRVPDRVEQHAAPDHRRVFISPLARKLARQAGLDYERLEGTGPHGRIRKRDVEAALANGDGSRTPVPSTVTEPLAPTLVREEPDGVGYTDVEHSRLRRAVASRLAESKSTIPHFYLRGTANVEKLVALRAELNAVGSVKVSFNDLLVKAVAVAHRQHPEMNVIWTENAVRTYDHVGISVAIASDRGLVTPVLREVETMSVTEIAAAVRDFVVRANAGKLKQDELEGGTVTISNLGMYGTEEFSAIINPPQAAILSVGAIRDAPIVRDGRLEVGKVLSFVLSADHRPVDGAVAADWMRTFLGLLEAPLRILA